MKLVPDTSAVIDGRITGMLKTGEYKDATIIIPEAVVAELEAQANQGREIGFLGLAELQELSRMAREGTVTIQYEHNLDVIKTADWVVDLGPGGRKDGGRIVAEGTPEQVAGSTVSVTGGDLRNSLHGISRPRRKGR